MNRLYEILNKFASDALIETGTTDGWAWKKYSDGTMTATKSISTTTTWTTVVAPLANNQTLITKPSNMATVTGGKSVIQQGSTYVVNSVVQLSQGTPILSTHRLSTSASSIAFNVTLEGTY